MTKLVQIPFSHWVRLGKRIIVQDDPEQKEILEMVRSAHKFWEQRGGETNWARNITGMGFVMSINDATVTTARIKKAVISEGFGLSLGRMLANNDNEVVLPVLVRDKKTTRQTVKPETLAEPEPEPFLAISVSLTREQWGLIKNALQYTSDRTQNYPLAEKLREIKGEIDLYLTDGEDETPPLRVVR
jgi:hypothetical protein